VIEVWHKKLEQDFRCLACDAGNCSSLNRRDLQQSRFIILNLKFPVVRAYAYPAFDALLCDEQWDALNHVWVATNISDVMDWVLIRAAAYSHEELVRRQATLCSWVERVEHWWHSDGLSALLVRVLEHDRELLTTLQQWNQSDNPWKRRQSIVSLLYYARMRKRILPFDEMIVLVENLIDDQHYYVQKGVGWTLRELFNVYPNNTFKFVQRNAAAISSIAWPAVVEKMSQQQKDVVCTYRRTR
jgi:3-methyladenine DNA glycosylase AlkD